jgi:UDP-N-acetylglucosamine 4,6-dehydratase/5-epimerase
MSEVISGKTVLVTGGTGSIGSGIVRELLARKAKRVIVFSRDEIKHFMMKRRILDERLETIVGDVRDLKSAEQPFRHKIDLVYHAAAMKHVVMCEEFPEETVKTNVLGTKNIVDLVLKYGVPEMITISTDKAAYPTNVMGAAKFIAERLTLNGNELSNYTQRFSCVRFGNVANSRGSVIPVYIDNLIHCNPLEVTDIDVTRFIMEISDAVALIIKATEITRGGEIFIFKMKAFRLGDLVDVITKRIAPRLNIDPKTVRIEKSNLFLGEKLHEDLINNTELSRLTELDDMLIISNREKASNVREGIPLKDIGRYCSSGAPSISNDELERIILNYLTERDMIPDV